MQLTKTQIEAVKYQLKKLEATATNDEVRQAAESVEKFDASVIADKVVSSRTTSLSTEVDNSMITLLQQPETTSALTTATHELTNTPKNEIISFDKQATIEKITSRLDCKISNKGVMLIAEAFDDWVVQTREQAIEFEALLIEYINQNIAQLVEENSELIDRVLTDFEKKAEAHGLDIDDVLTEVKRRTAAKADANKSYILSRLQAVSRRN